MIHKGMRGKTDSHFQTQRYSSIEVDKVRLEGGLSNPYYNLCTCIVVANSGFDLCLKYTQNIIPESNHDACLEM